jgi:DNA polymerase (family 10)
MAQLDIVIAAIHGHFDQDSDTVTKRVITAMEHPLVQFVAHPSGRLVGQRSPLLIDFDQLFEAAVRTGTMFEVNSNPERLDLHDQHCRIVRNLKIPVIINTDAHAILQLDNMKRGILQARRGMLTAHDVVNTRPLPAMLQLLNRKRNQA